MPGYPGKGFPGIYAILEMEAANEPVAPALLGAVLVKPSAEDGNWKCKCGCENTRKFCTECGVRKPTLVD